MVATEEDNNRIDEVYARIAAKQAVETAQAETINAELENALAIQEQLSQMVNSIQSDTSVISQITALTNIICNLKNCMDTNGGNRGGQQQNRGKGKATKDRQHKTGK